MRGTRSMLFVVTLFLGIAIFKPALAAEQKAAAPLPKMIGAATLGIGSAAHASAVALGEVLKEKSGIDVRVIPSDAEKPRVNLLRTGSAQFAVLPGGGMYYVQLGLEDYAVQDWGPQPIQMAWLGPAYLGMVTTQSHKDINAAEDIKGKRIAVLPHKSTVLNAEAFLNFAGLTWNDVVRVTVPGYNQQFKALMAGQVDVAPIGNPVTSVLYELEASPNGLKWLPFPHNNEKGWQALRKIAPWAVPAVITTGCGLSKEKPLEGYMHAYAFVALDKTDPELVYLVTRTIAENLDRLHSMAGAWKVYTMDLALRTEDYPHVYHPGAIRFFKEKGLWTDKHDEWNNRQIEIQNRLMEAWTKFLEEAKSGKWSAEDLKKNWTKRQVAITGYTMGE